MDQLCTFLFKM